MVSFTTLDEMLNSIEWQAFESDQLGNGLFLSDPDRADRNHNASADGCDGSTPGEHIADWRDFLNNLDVNDPGFDEPGHGDMMRSVYGSIMAEIADVEDWHDSKGTLDTVCG